MRSLIYIMTSVYCCKCCLHVYLSTWIWNYFCIAKVLYVLQTNFIPMCFNRPNSFKKQILLCQYNLKTVVFFSWITNPKRWPLINAGRGRLKAWSKFSPSYKSRCEKYLGSIAQNSLGVNWESQKADDICLSSVTRLLLARGISTDKIFHASLLSDYILFNSSSYLFLQHS